MKTVRIIALVLLAGTLSSCVSMKKYRQTKADLLRSQAATIELRDEVEQLREEQQALAGQQSSANTAELEALLRQRTAALAEIRALLDGALTGFNGKGLSVTERNGQLYVSMPEKLLFESGKWDVSPEGARAIREVSSVLAKHPGVRVVVEGHTDNLPYRAKKDEQVLDNWDLSVKRSTAVIRILTENKGVNPKQVSAAGRSQYAPVATGNNDAARAQNRRTEIILTPDPERLAEALEEAARVARKR